MPLKDDQGDPRNDFYDPDIVLMKENPRSKFNLFLTNGFK